MSRITCNFIMEIQCEKQNKSLPKFSNPLWETSSEAERGRERQVFIGKRQTIGDWREREKRELNKSWAPAPPSNIRCQSIVLNTGFQASVLT